MRPTTTEIQQVYQLAYYLHPERLVALQITQEALFDWLPVLQKGQHKRHQQRGILARVKGGKPLQPYKLSLPPQGLLQVSVYHVSERWERDQEQHTFCLQNNSYHPTHDDLLIRYVKHLIVCTMERHIIYSALALGCQLYQYSPTQISQLAPDLFPEDNIRRVYGTLLEWIRGRFPTLPLEQRPPYGTRKVRTRPPLAHERSLILEALEMCTPWWTSCLQPTESLLDLFTATPAHTGQTVPDAGKRLHALIHPTCAGMERFIRDYNQEMPTMPFDEPHNRLEVPAFQHNEPQSPAGPERTNPESRLNEETLAVLQGGFARRQQRRRHFQASMLRVYVDGILQVQFHPRDGVCPPFYVFEHARYLDVYGQDQVGDLLIAVFPLSTLTSAEETQAVLSVTHAGGQTVTLRIVSDVAETAASAAGWRVQVTYAVHAAPWRRLWRSWCDSWQGVQSWLHRLYAYRLAPACATGLMLFLCLSTIWLGVAYWQQQNQRTPEKWRSGMSATARILVEFQADSPEYEVRVLLQSIGGRIVDGPSAEGRYIVEISLGAAAPEALQKVLHALQQRSDVLRFVEPLKTQP